MYVVPGAVLTVRPTQCPQDHTVDLSHISTEGPAGGRLTPVAGSWAAGLRLTGVFGIRWLLDISTMLCLLHMARGGHRREPRPGVWRRVKSWMPLLTVEENGRPAFQSTASSS